MRNLFLAAAAAVVATGSASASVLVLGGTLAASCYRSAESRLATDQSIRECSDAFATEGLTPRDRVATHINRGILHLVRNDFSSADADFSAAMALDPREPEAWLNKGIMLVKSGKSADAVQPLDRSLALRTAKPALAYYARGLAHEDQGDIKAAYNDLRQAQALAPKWREVSLELARYQVRAR